jgi:hypothetical protein
MLLVPAREELTQVKTTAWSAEIVLDWQAREILCQ